MNFDYDQNMFGTRVETDEELRARITYVAGENQSTMRELLAAAGDVLDAMAERFNLRRRRGKELN